MNKTDRKFLDEAFASMFSNPVYRDYLFYAHILGQCSVKIDSDLPAPAGVAFVQDHFELYINPVSMSQFPVNQRIGIMKHEALHIIMGHLGSRMHGLNHRLMNLSTDCSINQMINRDDLPEGCIYPDTLQKYLKQQGISIKVPVNLSSEEYYNILKNNLPKDPDSSDGESGESEGSGESNDSGEAGEQEGNSKPKELDDHSKFGEEIPSEEFLKERTKNLLEKAKEATLMSNGSLPQNYSGMIALNSPKKSDIPWQKLFQNVSSNTKKNTRETYMRRSRRFKSRPEIKGKTHNREFDWLCIADVSGSMPSSSLQKCLGEMVLLCKKMDTEAALIQVDVSPEPSIQLSAKVKKFERKASGGTNMYPGIEQAKLEKLSYDAVVIITDGGLSDSDINKFRLLRVPVIWIITDDYGESLERFRDKRMKAARLVV